MWFLFLGAGVLVAYLIANAGKKAGELEPKSVTETVYNYQIWYGGKVVNEYPTEAQAKLAIDPFYGTIPRLQGLADPVIKKVPILFVHEAGKQSTMK